MYKCLRRRGQGLILLAAVLGPVSGGAGGAADIQVADLAVRYEHGEGVTLDRAKARSLYCFGALFGDADAIYGLAWMVANGRGMKRDDAVAAEWLGRGAQTGDIYAARLLAQLGNVQPAPDPFCPPPDSEPTRAVIEKWVRIITPVYDLEPDWVLAVIEAESNFRVRARSPVGAQGLMQLMPATARRFDVEDAYQPLPNLLGGIRYLRWLLDHFDGDPTLALAGYNAGEGAVRRYQGVPPYRETQGYLRKILRRLQDCDE